MSLTFGRDHLAIPGPSVIPSRVLQAMHRPAPDIYSGELVELTNTLQHDLNRLAGCSGHAVLYIGNGHAAWEAALVNVLAPGEHLLALSSGRFGRGWAAMGTALGIDVQVLDAEHGHSMNPETLEHALRADTKHRIRAVSTVQSDTSSSVRNDIAAVRAAIDSAGHPALLLVDGICSFGCEPFKMDELGVDVYVTACQKGLMTPPGLAIVFAGHRAQAARSDSLPRSAYWDWRPRIAASTFPERFGGTPPTHHLYGLREALDLLFEEGPEAVWKRHEQLASMVWAALDAWSREGKLRMHVPDTTQRSRAVTAVHTAPGDATRLRDWCKQEAGVTLGIGMDLGVTAGAVVGSSIDAMFRIGHMGHLNVPMLIGTLGSIDVGLKACGITHGTGALEAANASLAAADRL